MKQTRRICTTLLAFVMLLALGCTFALADSDKPVVKSSSLSVSNGSTKKTVTESTVFGQKDKLIATVKMDAKGDKPEGLRIDVVSEATKESVGEVNGKKAKDGSYTFTLPVNKIKNPIKGAYSVILKEVYEDGCVKQEIKKIGSIKIGFGAEKFNPGKIVVEAPVFESTTVKPGESADITYSVCVKGAVPAGCNRVTKLSLYFYQNGKLIDKDCSLDPDDTMWCTDIPQEAKEGILAVKLVAEDANSRKAYSPLVLLTVGSAKLGKIVLTAPVFEKSVYFPGEETDVKYTAAMEGVYPEDANAITEVELRFYQDGKLVGTDGMAAEDTEWDTDIPKKIKNGKLTVKIMAVDQYGNKKYSASTELTIKGKKATKISFTEKSITLKKGVKNIDVDNLYLRVSPGGVCWNFLWSSSNTKVVTVEDGNVNAVGKGSCVITCKVPGTKLSAKLTINVK